MKPDISAEAFKSLLRLDFKSFVIKVFNEVSPNNEFLDNWHINIICNELMNVSNNDNDKNRLIINIPPRYLKSIICSVAYPAFILGHNPKTDIICVSYSDELASKFALDCKRIMETHWYKKLFPHTQIAKDKKAVNDFTTTRGGGRYATSVNGTLTGRGADYIIIDDPIKPIDAFSDTIREKTNQWYGHTLYSRLNSKNKGKIIVIMQRIHDEDFTGFLLNNDPTFKLVKIQAIAEQDEIWTIKDIPTGKQLTIKRKKGEALHPEREDLSRLQSVKKYMGEFNFSGQYQQNPAPREGALIKRNWLQYYNREELNKNLEEKIIKPFCLIQSWDTANKVEEHNDYSVCLTILLDNKDRFYILDCYRVKLEFPALIKKVKEKYDEAKSRHKCPVKLFIEDYGSGTHLIQTLKKDYNIYSQAIKADYDKATRLQSVSHFIENGSCLFPPSMAFIAIQGGFFMRDKVDLPKSLRELQSLENESLKELWLRYFRELPKITDLKMVRILWYKVQCESRNLKIEPKNITRLNRYSADPDRFIEKSHKAKYRLRNGTEIVKTYKGREYKVRVKSPSEFVLEGQVYGTLSAVALALCGKKVSGYDFFGLNNKLYEKNIIEKEAGFCSG